MILLLRTANIAAHLGTQDRNMFFVQKTVQEYPMVHYDTLDNVFAQKSV